MNTILKQNGLRFGLILGIALFIPSLIGAYISINFIMSNYTFLTVILTTVFIGILAIGFAKKALFGSISFKECFSTYFVMILIGLLIQGLFNFMFFNYIETDFVPRLKSLQIENYEEYRTKVIANKEWIDEEKEQQIKQINSAVNNIKTINPYAPSSILKGCIIFTGIFSVFGILISLLLKTPQKEE